MSNSTESAPSFLRDALKAYTAYTNLQKQDIQKRAFKWLQNHIEIELSDKNIMGQFAQKWRTGNNQSSDADKSPIHLENLPGSYKGSQSINLHQEDALVFLQENVPEQLQNEFKKRWNAENKLEVSNSAGAEFKIDERELTSLQQEDSEGDGTAWYRANHKQVFYVLSYEEKDDYYQVVLAEDLGVQNRNTWFVAKKDVKISKV